MMNPRGLRRDARVVVHDDEHAILKAMLSRALGDDDCFRRLVSGEPSESGRVEDRRALARFLDRMERQFALRAQGHADGPFDYTRVARNGDSL